MSTTLRRVTAALATTAVAAATLTTVTSGAARAAPPYDIDAPRTGADWLAAQLDDGLLPGQFSGYDYGLTVDAGLALLETGDSADAVAAIDSAVADDVEAYISYVDGEAVYRDAGPTAKTAVFARAAGSDPTAYGGVDLVERLESLTTDDGRIFDIAAGEPSFLTANAISQSFAARALDEAGSAAAPAATDFLLAQQCEEGYFRLNLSPPDDAVQGCGADDGPSIDTTALAVVMLQGQDDDADVALAVDRAVAWLEDTQGSDGSFVSDDLITAANANSTGLAGWALGEAGAARPAERAAAWLRAHQAVRAGTCRPYVVADEGAIAYDDAALAALDGASIDDTGLGDQFRRATAQALPALEWAPDGVRSEVTSRSGFVRSGSVQQLVVAASPGDLVCVKAPGGPVAERVGLKGRARFDLTMASATGTVSARVTDGDEVLGRSVFRVLAAADLRVVAPARLTRGDRLAVTVRGLETGERATVAWRGKRVGAAKADRAGRAVVRFVARGATGPARVRVTGAFANRSGTDTVRVAR